MNLTLKVMKVDSHEISVPTQIAAVNRFLSKIRQLGAQRALSMEAILIYAGVPHGNPAYRGADRLLTKMRKAGYIEYSRGIGWIISPTAESIKNEST